MKWSRGTGQLAKVALEALRGDKTIQEIAAQHQVHPNQASTWKRQAVEAVTDVLPVGACRRGQPGPRSRNYTPRSGGEP